MEEKKKFNPLAKDWIMGKAGEKESQAKDESPVETVDESVESEGKKKFNPSPLYQSRSLNTKNFLK